MDDSQDSILLMSQFKHVMLLIVACLMLTSPGIMIMVVLTVGGQIVVYFLCVMWLLYWSSSWPLSVCEAAVVLMVKWISFIGFSLQCGVAWNGFTTWAVNVVVRVWLMLRTCS